MQHPVAKSILGKVVVCAISEAVGGMIGAYLCGPLFGLVCKGLGEIVPIAAAGAGLFRLQKRIGLVALAVLGVPNPFESIPASWGILSSFSSSMGYGAGYWLGQGAGTILGGYAGLKMAGSDVPFWDHTVSCDGYSVGMTKFLMAGEIFERVVAKCTVPIISLPVNLVRTVSAIVIKAIAYNSNSVSAAFKSLVRQRGLGHDVLVPLFVKLFLSRYCQQNATPITNKLIYAISQPFNFVPLLSAQVRKFLSLFSDHFKDAIKTIGGQGDKVTTLIMRRFIQYNDLVRNSESCKNAHNLEELEAALKNELDISEWKLKILEQIEIESKLEPSIAASLKSIEDIERELIGQSILKNTAELKSAIALHSKYFLLFLLQDIQFNLLTPEEEKRFFLVAANNYFSIYPENRGVLLAKKVVDFAISAFFLWKMRVSRFFMQKEQDVILLAPVMIPEDVGKRPPSPSSPNEDYVLVGNS
ncbi:MAG: hypothetical protein K1X28_10590 [Parachlamydiales bacterium]|nr:hypothetical protein [Parachlamydiales bacterium]